MKRAALLLSLAGFALAAALFVQQDLGAIVRLVASAGPGLVAVSLAHVVPMTLNARAWQHVLPRATRPGLAAMTRVVWLRESVNALLPVARVGGELVAYRVLAWTRLSRAFAAASLVVDMAISLLSQLVFALLGVGLLLQRGGGMPLAGELVLGLGVVSIFTAGFILAQHGRLFERLARVAAALLQGRLQRAVEASRRIDRVAVAIYRRRTAVLACFAWQLAGWLAGALEIGLALHVLGHPVGALDALAIEAVIQAISSAAFAVPGALGIQEGGFVLVGALLGIDAPLALALAAARRIRDLVIFLPGLIVWNILERGRLRAMAPTAAGGRDARKA